MRKPIMTAMIARLNRGINALYDRLPEHERAKYGEPGAWSPKDVVAHIAAWMQREVGNLEAAERGEALTRYGDYEAINAGDFERYRDWPWDRVLEMAAEANRGLTAQITARGEAELDVLWRGERTLWQSIMGTGFMHPTMHLARLYLDLGETTYATQLQEAGAAALLSLGGNSRWQGMVHYDLACHYALAGSPEQAVQALTTALQMDPALKDWVKEDLDFAAIRDAPGFQALLES